MTAEGTRTEVPRGGDVPHTGEGAIVGQQHDMPPGCVRHMLPSHVSRGTIHAGTHTHMAREPLGSTAGLYQISRVSQSPRLTTHQREVLTVRRPRQAM